MMTAAELKKVFENNYSREEWINVLREVFLAKEIHINPPTVDLKENRFDAKAVELGHFDTAEGLVVGVYEVAISPEFRLEHNKVGLRNLLRNVYTHDVDAAFIVFSQGHTWRFTYVSEITVHNKETGKREKRKTDPKRYTYIFGRHQLCRTAAERFAGIQTSTDLFGSGVSIKEIEKAFSVDLLTKDFYRELSNWYFWALQHVEFPDDAEKNQEVRNSTNTIRLITRLVFVWFLKQKKLVPEELFDPAKILPQLNPGYKNDSLYYKAILQNLFFATLNQEMGKRGFRKGKQHYNITSLFRYEKYFKNPQETLELFKGIPFLNGGLFECLDKPHPTEKTPQGAERIVRVDGFSDRDDNPVSVPDYLFFGGADAVDLSMVYEDRRQKNVKVRGLIDILNSYNFTVEENTPLDIQVALDPELLGKVFENLLASYNPETKTTARKQTGSFYTPREIVQYMVDESLISCLKPKLTKSDDADEERIESMLRELLSYSGNGNPFNPEETRLLIEAIDQIKVLDPACGSGAFPMGVLQQLVHILQKLDPENTEWKKIQMQRAQAELQYAIASGDADNFSERIKEIAESFESNTEDYGRKLFLIENCIYGVDIQPIAVQIAKLRFFVSLLCEQTIQEEKENLGIKALPNLETKFVAANTLIGLDTNLTFKPNKVYVLEKELEETRHRHFSARTPETKRKYRKRDGELRREIANELINVGFPENSANQVAIWDPFDQNTTCSFFNMYWMFGNGEGFDIVIGNPPYVQLQKDGGNLAKLYQNHGYETFERTGDIYSIFYEKGYELLKNGGVITYITSNKWMRAGYGKSLRNFFIKGNPLLLVDFGQAMIFESAIVHSNILVLQKGANLRITKMFQFEDESYNSKITIADYVSEKAYTAKHLSEGIWAVTPENESGLKVKFERFGKPLKDWEINFFRGVLTGYNDAFIINDETKNELVHLDKKNQEILKPILRGRDTRRYYCNYAGLWMIATFPSLKINIDAFPEIKKYLSKFGVERLSQSGAKGSRKKTSNKWFESQDSISYWGEFEKPKIIFSEIVSEPQFYYDTKGYCPEATVFFISGEKLRYLTALLNSKAVTFVFKKFYAGGELVGKYRYKKAFLEKLPIPIPGQAIEDRINALVDEISGLKSQNSSIDTRDLEREIDLMVFKLYQLTFDEVLIIDPEFGLSKTEYEQLK